jgi:nitroreductase
MASGIKELILRRRTSKPANFSERMPDPALIRDLIETARHAPNHHRTEPARFYLLDQERIKEVGRLFGEVVAVDESDPSLVERGKKKAREWGASPGLLVVTCHTDLDSELARNKPTVIEENYATCSCICQNLLLLFENEGISAKWSTGPVFEHPKFTETIGMQSPECESVVALLFYGYSETELPERTYAPLETHLRDFTA